jgi:hypothetical protein
MGAAQDQHRVEGIMGRLQQRRDLVIAIGHALVPRRRLVMRDAAQREGIERDSPAQRKAA